MHRGDFASRCLQLRVRRGGHRPGKSLVQEAQGTQGPPPAQAGTFLLGGGPVWHLCRAEWDRHVKDRQEEEEEAELHSQLQE